MDRAELEQTFDYLLFVEYELPMEMFTKLDDIKKELFDVIERAHNEALERTAKDYRRRIAQHLKETVAEVAMRVQVVPNDGNHREW